jgi:hypothetical protein
MPSFSRRANALFSLFVVAALTVTIRLPFLLHADRFFDSDEAVEGLMASHVLQGERPVFLWGQRYKGVPEVYLNAAVFSAAGASVGTLKATTLACFALAACLQFVLIEKMFSSRVAWMATALLIVGPPSLVLWTLSANAEVVLTMIAGALMGLAVWQWERSGSSLALAGAAAAIGFGLWVHQYILYYLVALAVTLVWTKPAVRARLREIVEGRGLPSWLRLATAAVGAIAALYLALGLMAFLTGGFDVTVGGLLIGMKNPQKLWRLGAALSIVYGLARFAAQLFQTGHRGDRSMAFGALIGFLIGYAPVLAANHGSLSLPLARMDARDLLRAAGTIGGSIVPMVLGFRSPLTEWLPVSPWLGIGLAVVIAVSFVALLQGRVSPFFHILLVVVPIVFVASGSYHDPQSYRYLIPLFAALPVVLALGIEQIGQWNRLAAGSALALMVLMFAAQEVAWYRRLAPDARSQTALECLTRNGVRGAFADYWMSYKLTFLSHERIIVAPTTGVDRYPPYTEFVRSLGVTQGNQPCESLLLQ